MKTKKQTLTKTKNMNILFRRIYKAKCDGILRYTKAIFVPVLSILFIIGCEQNEDIDPMQQSERLELNNDEADLNRDVVEKNDTIEIKNEVGFPGGRIASTFDLVLVTEIPSPSVDGDLLQSTAVDLTCEKAIVSFNVQGDTYKGGIKVLNIEDKTKVTSYLQFKDADIHNVHFS